MSCQPPVMLTATPRRPTSATRSAYERLAQYAESGACSRSQSWKKSMDSPAATTSAPDSGTVANPSRTRWRTASTSRWRSCGARIIDAQESPLSREKVPPG